MAWGVVALVMAAVMVAGIAYTVVSAAANHRTDSRIVDLRNRGMSVTDIAIELQMTEEQVRERIRRITGAAGPGPPSV